MSSNADKKRKVQSTQGNLDYFFKKFCNEKLKESNETCSTSSESYIYIYIYIYENVCFAFGKWTIQRRAAIIARGSKSRIAHTTKIKLIL
jgi:hypothetical protein